MFCIIFRGIIFGSIEYAIDLCTIFVKCVARQVYLVVPIDASTTFVELGILK